MELQTSSPSHQSERGYEAMRPLTSRRESHPPHLPRVKGSTSELGRSIILGASRHKSQGAFYSNHFRFNLERRHLDPIGNFDAAKLPQFPFLRSVRKRSAAREKVCRTSWNFLMSFFTNPFK